MEHSSYDFSQVDQSGLAQMTFGILKIRWLMVQNSSIVYLPATDKRFNILTIS